MSRMLRSLALLAATGLAVPTLANAQCSGACTTSSVGGEVVHVFTGNGQFTAPAGVTSIDYLVVGGGGGGGGVASTNNAGGAGGGGAGGFRTGATAVTPLANYAVTVGAGGTPGVGGSTQGGNGGPSSIGALITSNGGGG
ncbi:MAG TPA: hypothetical protein VEB41_01085, partial [Burkholderiales bacterium]|nr:hypothetical protein [Burkholderiales bacterium]